MNLDDVAPSLVSPGDEDDPRFVVSAIFEETARLEALQRKLTIKLNNLKNTIVQRNRLGALLFQMKITEGRWRALVRIVDTVNYDISPAQGGPTLVRELARAEGRVVLDETRHPAVLARENKSNQPELQFAVSIESVESDEGQVWTEFQTGAAVVGLQKNAVLTFRSVYMDDDPIYPRTPDMYDSEEDDKDGLDMYRHHVNVFVANVGVQDGCLVVATLYAPED